MINWDEPIETIEGRPAKLVHTLNTPHPFTRCVVHTGANGNESLTHVNDNGCWCGETPFIRNKPMTVERWLTMYRRFEDNAIRVVESVDRLKVVYLGKIIAQKLVTITEGEGL